MFLPFSIVARPIQKSATFKRIVAFGAFAPATNCRFLRLLPSLSCTFYTDSSILHGRLCLLCLPHRFFWSTDLSFKYFFEMLQCFSLPFSARCNLRHENCLRECPCPCVQLCTQNQTSRIDSRGKWFKFAYWYLRLTKLVDLVALRSRWTACAHTHTHAIPINPHEIVVSVDSGMPIRAYSGTRPMRL